MCMLPLREKYTSISCLCFVADWSSLCAAGTSFPDPPIPQVYHTHQSVPRCPHYQGVGTVLQQSVCGGCHLLRSSITSSLCKVNIILVAHGMLDLFWWSFQSKALHERGDLSIKILCKEVHFCIEGHQPGVPPSPRAVYTYVLRATSQEFLPPPGLYEGHQPGVPPSPRAVYTYVLRATSQEFLPPPGLYIHMY